MIAFHGKPEIKELYLSRVRAHIAADELVHGRYWEHGKGCAVGCTIHSGNHSAYETELGIPRLLAKIEDGIFEGMGNGRSKTWPQDFLSSIAVGADLSNVWPQFAAWLMLDEKWGVIQYAKNAQSIKVIRDVGEAYQSMANGEAKEVNWNKLRADAADYADYAVDADAAYAAEYVAYVAAYAAYAAAYAADYATNYAAYAAYAAGTRKKSECREAQAAKLLELLAAAPVPVA